MFSLRSVMEMLVKSGIPPSKKLEYANNVLKFSQWVRAQGGVPSFEDRTQLYAYLRNSKLGDAPIDFLEFGVYKGASMVNWTELVKHPASRFYGFDTFHGLPEFYEDRGEMLGQGVFSTDGLLPDISDPRVAFVTGLFQSSLKPFLNSFTPQNRLVIHLDADLYTSTLFVLTSLDSSLLPGTIIIVNPNNNQRFGNLVIPAEAAPTCRRASLSFPDSSFRWNDMGSVVAVDRTLCRHTVIN